MRRMLGLSTAMSATTPGIAGFLVCHMDNLPFFSVAPVLREGADPATRCIDVEYAVVRYIYTFASVKST
jgi:hypothetical protein